MYFLLIEPLKQSLSKICLSIESSIELIIISVYSSTSLWFEVVDSCIDLQCAYTFHYLGLRSNSLL